MRNRLKRSWTSLSRVQKEPKADEMISQMRVSALLESRPAMSVADPGFVRKLSAEQRTALEDEHGQLAGAGGSRRGSHLSADHGVYSTAPTPPATPDPDDEDEDDWDDEVEPEEMPHPGEGSGIEEWDRP